MNFDSLKDQLRDEWNQLLGKIQENPWFQTLKERFDGLSLNAQRGLILGGAVLVILFILSFPYAYVSSGSENLASFEENRNLIRELLQASRTIKESSPLPAGLSVDVLKTQASSVLAEVRLVPEQIGDIQPLAEKPAGALAPAIVQQAGVSVPLKNLNLRQIVDIGHRLQSLSPGVRLMGLDIVRSAKQTHYYDVVYKVVSFSLPRSGDSLGEPGARAGRALPGRRGVPNKRAEPEEDSAAEEDGAEEDSE